MINPWKTHKARAVIAEIPRGLYQTYKVRLDNGCIVEGYDLPARFSVGDAVCIEAQFSIMADKYMIRVIRRAPMKRARLRLVSA